MKYFEMFTGIAGFSKGIEQAYERDQNSPQDTEQTIRQHQTGLRSDGHLNNALRVDGERRRLCSASPVGFSEIGKTANAILKYRYPDVTNYGDAAAIVCDELPDFDFLVGGFPCQAFSIAGKRKGFADSRGTLFFEIARILAAKRPGHFLLENVAGLLSHDNGQTFRTIIAALDEIGYDLEWTVINSKHHGVPQNRERVFIIGHPRGGSCGEILSFGESDGEFDGSCGQRNDIAHTITKDGEGFREMASNISPTLNGRARQDGSQQPVIIGNVYPSGGENGDVLNPSGISKTLKSGETANPKHGGIGSCNAPKIAIPVLTPDRATKRQNGRRMKEDGEARFTVTAQDQHGVFTGQRIRRLTPVECARLQGFEDDHADFGLFEDKHGEWHVKEISDTGKYQVFGNAVTVNVIEAIVSKMIEKGCLEQ